MKAIRIPAALALLLCVGMAACKPTPKSSEPSQNQTQAQSTAASSAFAFAPKGQRFAIGDSAAPVLSALGAALDVAESPSCATDAVDRTYRYAGFELTETVPVNAPSYITGMRLTDDSYNTPEGLTIGSPASEIELRYGKPAKTENDFLTYGKTDRSTLQFHIKEGVIDQIVYGYDWAGTYQ